MKEKNIIYRKNKLNIELVNKIFAKNNYDEFQPELVLLHFDCEKEENVIKNLTNVISRKYLSMRPPKYLKSQKYDV